MGELEGDDVADWLSGVMIGREVRNARTWAHRHGYDGARVRLIGDDALVARYAAALAQADVVVERAHTHAAAYRAVAHRRAGRYRHDSTDYDFDPMNPLRRYLDPLPLIAVLRGITPEEVAGRGRRAVRRNGFRILEVPLNSPRAVRVDPPASRQCTARTASSAPAPCCASRTSRACARPGARSS